MGHSGDARSGYLLEIDMTTPSSSSHDTLLTLNEAADRLRVSRRHLSAVMASGDGPPVVPIGRRRLIRAGALQAWLAERERAA